MHKINRAQLIDDALNLAKAGYLGYETALGMTEYLDAEDEFVPWSSAKTAFSYIQGGPTGFYTRNGCIL